MPEEKGVNKDTELRNISIVQRIVSCVSPLVGGTIEGTGRARDGWQQNQGEHCMSQ